MPSTSNTRISCRLTAAQSSTLMPAGLSMNRRRKRPPFDACTSTSSYPMPATTGSITFSRLKQKMGRSPSHSKLRPAPAKLLKFNRFLLPEQPGNPLWRQFAPFAGIEIGRQLDRPVAHANQPADLGPDCVEHSPHLAIASLAQHHPVPAVGALDRAPGGRLDAVESRRSVLQG